MTRIVASIDPCTGKGFLYPSTISNKILNGLDAGNVRVDCSKYYGAIIHKREGGSLIQTTGKVIFGASSSSVYNKGGGYRSVFIIDIVDGQNVYEIPTYCYYQQYYYANETIRSSQQFQIINVNITIPDDYFDSDDELIPIWQYANSTTTSDDGNIYASTQWTSFSSDAIKTIEDAYTQTPDNGELPGLSIGIRSYNIKWNGVYGVQEDPVHHTKRAIQRILMKKSDVKPDEMTGGDGLQEEEGCCLCYERFGASQSITTPCCNKQIHSCCITPIANKGGCCPMCRSVIDWETLMGHKCQVYYGGGR
jgi:hypothetical protein